MRHAALILALGLLAAGCGGSSSSGSENGPIVLSASADGKYGIFRRDPDGQLTQLTRGRRDVLRRVVAGRRADRLPTGLRQRGLYAHLRHGRRRRRCSPADFGTDGGRRLLESRRRPHCLRRRTWWNLRHSGADGGSVTRLTPKGGLPAWSPDGDTIAFIRIPALYEMNADGTHQRIVLDSREAQLQEAPLYIRAGGLVPRREAHRLPAGRHHGGVEAVFGSHRD